MAQVFIIGAAGKVGRHLVEQLATRGHRAVALHRRPEQADALAALGGTPMQGDLTHTDAQALAAQMAGSEVVVFSAGRAGQASN